MEARELVQCSFGARADRAVDAGAHPLDSLRQRGARVSAGATDRRVDSREQQAASA